MVKRDLLKVAVYLEEVSEDPLVACQVLRSHSIPYVALKHVWSNNIESLSDDTYVKLRQILEDEDMTPILLAPKLGSIPAHELTRITNDQIQKIFNLVTYFKTPIVRISTGLKSPQDCNTIIDDWMTRITEYAISANVIPVLEITHDSYLFSPVDIADKLNKHKKWKLLYDPAQFILRQKMNPFTKYWSLLKQNVVAIDVRDIKIGRGFKPAGFGDAKIDMTIKDSLNNYRGWYIIEPSLGRRHGSAVKKEDTFKLALDAFENIINS